MFIKIIVPILIGVLARIILGGKLKVMVEKLIDIFIYLLIPLFILVSVWRVKFSPSYIGYIIVSCIITIFIGIGTAKLISKSRKNNEFRDIVLPVGFMNSGNVGIPVSGFLWGSFGVAAASIYNTVLAGMIFSAGIILITGKKNIKTVLKIPVIYAMLVGFFLNYLNIRIPFFVKEFIPVFNSVTIFLMLFIVGYRLGNVSTENISLIIAGSMGRFFSGITAAFVLFLLLSIPKELFGPIAVLCCTPSAINSYLLAEKFSDNPQTASGIVTLTTLIFLSVFYLAGKDFILHLAGS